MSLLVANNETLNSLDQILGNLNSHCVGVLGLGVAGRAMALYLARRGAKVIGLDSNVTINNADELKQASIELHLGDSNIEVVGNIDGLAISPGVDPRQTLVTSCLNRNIPVFGELELVGKLPARVVGITGTNGKSTTTAMIAALIKGVGKQVFIGGNFGEPLVAWLDRNEKVDTAVIELSSFQLETAFRFNANVAIILNLTPDHLNRYESFAEYGQAKRRIIENLSQESVAILSFDDPSIRDMATATKARVWWFSTQSKDIPGDGAFLDGELMVPVGSLSSYPSINLTHSYLLGRHNRQNALAAILAAYALNIKDSSELYHAYQEFHGLEHRLEFIDEVNGVRFINDSKATNDDAAAIAINAIEKPIVLLLGGRSKGSGYQNIYKSATGKLRAIVAFGEARDEIAKTFNGYCDLFLTNNMTQALRQSIGIAQIGDVVMLSPACASFDEFSNYSERGRVFKQLVHDFAKGRPI